MTGPNLTHFTRSIQAVVGILSNGFAWAPNRRNLISRLVPYHPFGEREPQQFGMISFTELDPAKAIEHRSAFGNFGISVSKAWARKHNAQKVIYVDRTGPVFEALCWLFQAGYSQVKTAIQYPDDAGLLMAFTNKAMASVIGAPLWANLLQIYEYLEPIEHADHQEWRIVQPYPHYGLATSRDELIKAVSPPRGWAAKVNLIPVGPIDVVRVICPASSHKEMTQSLPESFRHVKLQYLDV